ncbi:DUF2490 domain-containing protein [Aquimarina litoralis]|uniref:DUF2490 domain-containing protein n=1 Tax=Aquimarina litoralis TaxID=584605 RepID=UPI001C574CC8|nr:DUF2490 domain-containing protein [Aquimarina litoralis]MBW1295887.1 DUF2490 domain-containing protein [Aquimarina litoralis]
MNFKSVIVTFFCCLLYHYNHAQVSFTTGLLPKIVISHKLSDRIKLIHSVESRQQLWELEPSEDFSYDYLLTDFTNILSYKLSSDHVFNIGYLLRVEKDQLVHRSIFQYSIAQQLETIRIAHRFVTDQTFSSIESAEFRLRYRFTIEIPFNGYRVDPKEFYLKVNNEYLGSYQDNNSDLELRLIPLVGYEVNDKSKIEIGPDYRISQFLKSSTKNRLWFSINYYYAFAHKKL